MSYTQDYFWRLGQMVCMFVPIVLTYLYRDYSMNMDGNSEIQKRVNAKAWVVAPSPEYNEKWAFGAPSPPNYQY